MNKISVIVQTYNSAQHLDRVLTALKGFDEVIVADMESTDDTLDIARRHGAKIVVYPRGEHRICEAYRDRAIYEATHQWVFVVDSDEIVPPALCDYLYAEIKRDNTPRCIMIPRRNYYLGRWMRSSYPDYLPRFMAQNGTFWPNSIHSWPMHNGDKVKIPASRTDLALIHLANESVFRRIEKLNHYTDQEMARRRVGYRRWKLLFDPTFRFFKTYILKKGFMLGREGFIRAVLDSVYRFVVLAKLEEERRDIENSDLDNDLKRIGLL